MLHLVTEIVSATSQADCFLFQNKYIFEKHNEKILKMQIECEESCILLLIDAPSIHILSAFS